MNSAPGTLRRAVLSVHDKRGVVAFARTLQECGVDIIASGGTARTLAEGGIPHTPVEAVTSCKEVLGGRVKTLHPAIHAGILADRRDDAHMADLAANGYLPIDLVVCNLYPFQENLAERRGRADLIENIDIGGPTLVRAAAKNVDGGTTVLTDPNDYQRIADALRHGAEVPYALRQELAAKAFRYVASYDLTIAAWAETQLQDAETAPNGLPPILSGFVPRQTLRYGENPHQKASLYVASDEDAGLAHGRLLAGKPLSYNNLLDMDSAYRAAYGLRGMGCAVVKHTNPCGLAVADSQPRAFELALAGDPMAAFGGIIGFNQPVSAETAEAIRSSKLFVECIVAPGFAPAALDLLGKRGNLRLFEVPDADPTPLFSAHRISGGMLVQQSDPGLARLDTWNVVTDKKLEDGWLEELAFAMQAAAILKSNAIAITRNCALRGAGTGQMSRVDAAAQALQKAGGECKGAFMGSDAFFPFGDCVKLAANAGIVAVIQPGGSKRDQDSIDACNSAGLAMVFTGRRHFRH